MFYGISRSTDLRCPQTTVRKFSSKTALLKWMGKNSGNFTHDDPEAARNYHHTFKYGFELHGRMDTKNEVFKDFGSRDYPRNKNDQVYVYLCRYGLEIGD